MIFAWFRNRFTAFLQNGGKTPVVQIELNMSNKMLRSLSCATYIWHAVGKGTSAINFDNDEMVFVSFLTENNNQLKTVHCTKEM